MSPAPTVEGSAASHPASSSPAPLASPPLNDRLPSSFNSSSLHSSSLPPLHSPSTTPSSGKTSSRGGSGGAKRELPAAHRGENRREGSGEALLPLGPKTPHSERVQRISQRLSGIHVGLEQERSTREWLQEKVRGLEAEVELLQTEQSKEMADFRNQLQSVCSSLESESDARSKYQAAKTKEMAELSSRLSEAVERQQQRYQETELRCLSTFEEKSSALRDELLKEHLSLVDTQTIIQQYCNVEIPKLQAALKAETRDRAEMEERILKEASLQISAVTELIEQEKRAREEQSKSMLNLIEEVVSKMQTHIQREREERETTERTLFELLEDTISKLDAASQL